MSNAELQMRRQLRSNVDAYERSNADVPAAVMNPPATLLKSRYNPEFDAQIDLVFQLLYFTVNGGAYTQKTAAQILAAQASLATKLPVFAFGQSDFGAGYAKARQQFPVNVWAYEAPFIYGASYPYTSGGVLDAGAQALLTQGDFVQPFSATLGGVLYIALSVTSCSNVGYGTLLQSTNSDRFQINLIRFVQTDTTTVGLNQFAQKITWTRQTLFGKYDSDTATPNSYKQPENLQAGIIDIPLVKGITKEAMIGTYLLYTSVNVSWSLFIQTIKKAGDAGPL